MYIVLNIEVLLWYVLEIVGNVIWKDCSKESMRVL